MYKIIYSMLALLLVCCTSQPDPTDVQPQPGGRINVRAALYPNVADDKITGLRIMAFTTLGNRISSNRYYPEAEISEQITHIMTTGKFNFVIIANEPRDGIVNVALDNITFYSQLSDVRVAAASINDSDPIPMVFTHDNVTVLPNAGGVIVDGTTYSVWEVSLKRIAARLDLTLHSNTGSSADLDGVTLSGIPDYVPLIGKFSGTQSVTRGYTMNANPDRFIPVVVPGATWAVKIERIIIPSNDFTPADQSAKAVKLTVNLASGQINPSIPICINPDGGDFALPGNTYLKITGGIKYPFGVNIQTLDWGTAIKDGSLYGQFMLNLSTISTTITNRNTVRVYFSSNQPDVFIEPTGYVNATGNTTFSVNSVFSSVAGKGAPNLHYTSGTSEGYFDLYGVQFNTTHNNEVYRILVNANGLLREVTINLSVPVVLQNWSSLPFVGTFHRWNQTGERVVFGMNTGAWTATVEYPTGTAPFVKLSTERSLDPNLGSDATGDAEYYQVPGNLQTVGGNDGIYFRVGMQSILASADATPRYARIIVNATSGIYYTWVRQGEAADYIMRPQDPVNIPGYSSPGRTLAKKVSPFVLTDPLRGIGRVERGERGYVFTDYPTQGGYIFRFAGTSAWSLPAVYNVPEPNWPALIPTDHVWDGAGWETSPPGYHRPSDGGTSALISTGTATTAAFIGSSELRQSIWLNPPTGTKSNYENSKKGYYADGFFDRRLLRPYPHPGVNGPNSTAGTGTEIAYYGNIIYNETPDSYASVFFPRAATIIAASGYMNQGTTAIWLLSSESDGYARNNFWISSLEIRLNLISGDSGAAIRPFKD